LPEGGVMHRWVGILALMLLPLTGQAAWGQTCLVASTGVTFGTYDPFSPTASSITGTVTVTCQALAALNLPYSIQVGTGGGGSFSGRVLAAGAGRLAYQLYTTAARSTIWGDGSGGTGVVSDLISITVLGPTIRPYTIYGAIPARQIAAPGSYTDTPTVMVVY